MAEQTVIQREAPEIEAYKLGLMEQAKALAGTAPTEEQLASLIPSELGLSGLQQQAVDALTDVGTQGIGDYKDYLTDAGAGLDTAGQTLTSALDTLGRAETAGGLSTGIFDPTMVQEFMNPYQKAVTESALAQLNKQFLEQQAGRSAGAIGAGAFGGSRQGVLEGIAQRELGDVASRRIFEDLARNFGQAQQSAMTSFENQQRRGQLAAQNLANIGRTQAGIGQAFAQLDPIASGVLERDVSTLARIGATERGIGQAERAADFQNLQRQYLQPQQALSFQSGILGAFPTYAESQAQQTFNPLFTGIQSLFG